MALDFLNTLQDIIKQRKTEDPDHSYTAKLFKGGVDRIAKKVTEEAGEVIIAAKNRDPEELKNETADLLFHLLVLLEEQDVSLEQVLQTLSERHQPR